jgi:hypothetical protein
MCVSCLFRHVHETVKSNCTLASSRVCLSFCPSVHMQQFGSHWMDFHEIWHFKIFWYSVKKIQLWLKFDKNNGYFTWESSKFMILSCRILLRMRNVSDKSCRENRNTYLTLLFFWKSRCLWDKCGEVWYSQTCHKWKYNSEQKRKNLHAWQLRQDTLIIFNTSCTSTATVVTWMCLNVTFYIYCLSCYIIYTPCYISSDKNLIENAWVKKGWNIKGWMKWWGC